jgi:DNA-nicking Smr family endonuclease
VEESIDLHAFTPRDVVSVVGEYLEAAGRKRYREVRLIHGKGTGVQRAAVRALLALHPLVESYSDAPPQAGGWGATRVILKLPQD